MPKLFIISSLSNILASPIEYLKGVGPQRGDLLKKELNIFTFQDLLEHFPYRHVDKTKVSFINEITPQTDYIQVAGKLLSAEAIGDKRAKRLVAQLKDKTGFHRAGMVPGNKLGTKDTAAWSVLSCVWQSLVFIRTISQIVHPEIEAWTPDKRDGKKFFGAGISSYRKT